MLYDEEVEFWLVNHSPFFILIWSVMVFFVALAMIPIEIYYWARFKVGGIKCKTIDLIIG